MCVWCASTWLGGHHHLPRAQAGPVRLSLVPKEQAIHDDEAHTARIAEAQAIHKMRHGTHAAHT